jgi:threonine dehydratase
VLVKAEELQRKPFKMRGAYNRMRLLSADELARGVVAYSSGNHGQAVAATARLLGTTATVVMPADAPRTKAEKTRALGAEVVFYDRQRDDRVAIGRRLAEERGLTMVPPFENRFVMAGAGTVALETVRQAEAMGASIDVLIACCSGGGLAAGCGLVMRALVPHGRCLKPNPSASTTRRARSPPGIVSNTRSHLDLRQRTRPTPGGDLQINREHGRARCR